MKAARFHEFGGPDKINVDNNLPIPKPGPNEVLIKVSYAGVNPVDTYIRSGTYARKPKLPATPGLDSAGVVEAIGEGVTKFKTGDRVLTVNTTTGAYAEYATANIQFVAKLDSKLSFQQGASTGVPYYTAYKSIFIRANAKPGESILIHGASGAVGLAAVQIAKAAGLKVFGTAGTPEGLELVKKNGAEHVFNHRETGYFTKIDYLTGGNGVDIILEMLANVNLQADLEHLAFRGRVVVIGSRGNIEINPRLTMGKESQIMGVALLTALPHEWNVMHAALEAGQTAGWLQPVVAKEYSLAESSKAQDDVINKTGTLGNLVINVNQ